ncbi:MAG: hypothetical protein O8C63_12510 [Candidatus Methanoperedens sp.]|nr:hypothetical protein [Candidatus Methanoperedens sp.]
MKEQKDWLSAVEIIGKILLFTPIIVSLPPIIYAVLRGVNIGLGDAGAAYSAALMIFAGLLAIIYVSIQRYKEGNRS